MDGVEKVAQRRQSGDYSIVCTTVWTEEHESGGFLEAGRGPGKEESKTRAKKKN